MIEITFTYAALIGQLYLLSYYYPQQFVKRMTYVTSNYPASKYPKLYPSENGEEKAKKELIKFQFVTRLILFVGIALLGAISFTGLSLENSASAIFVVAFALIQTAPFIWIEVSELKHCKAMREKNVTHKRSADLKPRRYFDYISPIKFVIAAILLFAYLSFNLYRNNFDLSLDGAGFITLMAMIIMHVYFAIIVYWIMRGKKINPHMSAADRDRHISGTINTTLNISMLASIFLFVYGLIQHYDLDRYEAMAMSIYFQLCIYLGIGTMLKANKIEELDFDVYKDGTNLT